MFEVENISIKEEPVGYLFMNKHIVYVSILNRCLLLSAVVHCCIDSIAAVALLLLITFYYCLWVLTTGKLSGYVDLPCKSLWKLKHGVSCDVVDPYVHDWSYTGWLRRTEQSGLYYQVKIYNKTKKIHIQIAGYR